MVREINEMTEPKIAAIVAWLRESEHQLVTYRGMREVVLTDAMGRENHLSLDFLAGFASAGLGMEVSTDNLVTAFAFFDY